MDPVQTVGGKMELVGYKLFEEKRGGPCTLVHGMPFNGKRSRMLPLGQWVEYEEGTPGFNFFESYEYLRAYLPKFKVRAPRLRICQVGVRDILRNPRSNYTLAEQMIILPSYWDNRIIGSSLL